MANLIAEFGNHAPGYISEGLLMGAGSAVARWPPRRGLNIAHEAVDRHVVAGRGDRPVRFRQWLEINHMIHPDELARIDAEVAAEIAEAVAFAEAGTWEPVDEIARFTYADKAA